MTALITSLEAAERGSRLLDAQIEAYVRGDGVASAVSHGWVDLVGSMGTKFAVPALGYTSSIDTALALTERLLPGWTLANLCQQDDKTWFCELREGFLTSYGRVVITETQSGKRPKTPALALVIATLKAWEAAR